jgi:hypothetical protein
MAHHLHQLMLALNLFTLVSIFAEIINVNIWFGKYPYLSFS